MLENFVLENILFLDIETVPAFANYNEVPEPFRKLWDKKSEYLKREASGEETDESFYGRAGIYAEFGKIICISAGFFKNVDGKRQFRIKSYSGDDEKVLLNEFMNLLNNHFSKKDALLCAHNGKEFDFPYIARRALVNGLQLPAILDVGAKKPWETNFIDTMELWKFGDRKSFTSLNLLAALFNIPTPKDDIDGSQVGYVYWHEQDLARIAQYCQKDVITIAKLFLRFKGENSVEDFEIIYS